MLVVWLFGVLAFGHSRVLVVHVQGGDAMFHQSQWVQNAIPHGVSGWLLAGKRAYLWSHPEWSPQVWLSDTGSLREPQPSSSIPLVPAPRFAYGVRTREPDRDALRMLQRAEWAQIDLGEVARAWRYSELCTPKQAEQLQSLAWEHIDRWLSALARTLDFENDLLIVVGTPMEGTLWAVFIRGRGVSAGELYDPAIGIPLLARAESLLGLVKGGSEGRMSVSRETPLSPDELYQARDRWLAHEGVRVLYVPLFLTWLLIGVVSGMRLYRWARHRQAMAIVQLRGEARRTAPEQTSLYSQPRLPPVWLAQVAFALGVASLFSGGLANPTLATSAGVVVLGTIGLFGLVRYLREPLPALGVVSGIGIILLVLDSLSGGAWARWGLLGYSLLEGERFSGMGEGHGALLLCWALMLTLVWLRIEGNPLGGVYFLSLFALWLGWRAEHFGLTLSACFVASVLGSGVLIREHHERKRLRIAMLNRPARVVPVPPARTLWKHWVLLVGIVGCALWLSRFSLERYPLHLTLPKPNTWLSVEGGLFLISGVLLLLLRRSPMWHSVPKPFRWAWFGAGTPLLLTSPQGVLAIALLLFHFCAQILALQQQEESVPRRIPLIQ